MTSCIGVDLHLRNATLCHLSLRETISEKIPTLIDLVVVNLAKLIATIREELSKQKKRSNRKAVSSE
jgi:hypothetical protein